jgi:hypothetical protein
MRLAGFVLLLGLALGALGACGGKGKDAAEPGGDPTCCCTTADGREVLGETACQESGGSCEPTETCEADDAVDGGGVPTEDPADY